MLLKIISISVNNNNQANDFKKLQGVNYTTCLALFKYISHIEVISKFGCFAKGRIIGGGGGVFSGFLWGGRVTKRKKRVAEKAE